MDLAAGLLIVLLSLGILEYYIHRRNRRSIPVRIHVNGTRGKSSVTRLIAAGLRAGGIKTMAKTTGTLPRIIDEQGVDIPIKRLGRAKIFEQAYIFSLAARKRVQCLVIECMAVQPRLQQVCEEQIVRSTIGVMTNVRRDHLDVMGPTVEDAAKAMSITLPYQGVAFTAEHDPNLFSILEGKARSRGTALREVKTEVVGDEVLRGFSYVEHKDNVALALDVCAHLGVDKSKALQGMQQTRPDAGVLRVSQKQQGDKETVFINAMAANDPDSTLQIWSRAVDLTQHYEIIVLTNTRKDRLHRSQQLAETMACCMPADYYVMVGTSAAITVRKALDLGVAQDRVLDWAGYSLDEVVARLWNLTPHRSIVFAIGNIAGIGLELTRYFQGKETVDA